MDESTHACRNERINEGFFPSFYRFSSKYIFRGISPIPLHSFIGWTFQSKPLFRRCLRGSLSLPQAVEAAPSAHPSLLRTITPRCPPYFDGPEDHDLLIFICAKALILHPYLQNQALYLNTTVAYNWDKYTILLKSNYFSTKLHSKPGNLCLLLLPLLVARGEPHCRACVPWLLHWEAWRQLPQKCCIAIERRTQKHGLL